MIEGDFLYVIVACIICLPVLLGFFIKLRRYWLGGLLGISAFYVFNPWIVPFESTPWLCFLILGFLLMMIIGRLVRKIHIFSDKWEWYDKLTLFFSIWITLHFILERPGSARMGERGGLSIALPLLTCGWSYFVAKWCARFEQEGNLQIRIVFGIAVIAYIYLLAGVETGEFYIGFLYQSPMWLIASVILVDSINYSATHNNKRYILFVLFSGFVIVLSMASVHRAFALFGVVAVMLTSYCYRSSIRIVWITVFGGLLLFITITSYSSIELPDNIRRPLSIFGILGSALDSRESGWELDFRVDLFNSAISTIKLHPFWGSGAGFSSAEIFATMFTPQQLETTKSFHNALLTVSSAYGLPAGIALLAVFLGLIGKAVRTARGWPNNTDKYIITVLIAYAVPAMFQACVNGAGYHLTRVFICLGVMSIILAKNKEAESAALMPT